MKRVLVFGVLLMSLFLIAGCAAQQPTDEEKAQLEQLSDEELLELAAAENQAAVAGQAVSAAKLKSLKAEARAVLQARMLTKAQFLTLLKDFPAGTTLKVGADGVLTNPSTGESWMVPDRQAGTTRPSNEQGGPIQPSTFLIKDGDTISCENNQPVITSPTGGRSGGTGGRPTGQPTGGAGRPSAASCPADCYEYCYHSCVEVDEDGNCVRAEDVCDCVACGEH